MKRTIQILGAGGIEQTVEADVFGDWAVNVVPGWRSHGRGKPKPVLGITHVPTGIRASHWAIYGNRKVLCMIARRLNEMKIAVPVGAIAAAVSPEAMTPALRERMVEIGKQIEQACEDVRMALARRARKVLGVEEGKL